jgi:serine/threonine protein kinase
MTDPVNRLTGAPSDRYRIERELGAGGMATVYLAEDLRHRREVALKVLRPATSWSASCPSWRASRRAAGWSSNLDHLSAAPGAVSR